jgi:hypothetical protein
MYPTERLAKAKHDAVCAACKRLIKEGELRRGVAQVDGTWHSIHPQCLDAYEEQLAAGAAERPPSVRAAKRAELVEHKCSSCGENYAGRPEDVVDRCVCAGPLVDVDTDDRPAEVHVVHCSACRQAMRVRGRPYPLDGAPARVVKMYEDYLARVLCADCEAARGGGGFGLDRGTLERVGAASRSPAGSGGGKPSVGRLRSPDPGAARDAEPSPSESSPSSSSPSRGAKA